MSEWCDLEAQIEYAISAAVPATGSAGPQPTQELDDDAIFDIVTEIFRREINPSIASHGGAVDLLDVQDGTVVLSFERVSLVPRRGHGPESEGELS